MNEEISVSVEMQMADKWQEHDPGASQRLPYIRGWGKKGVNC